MCSTLKHTCMHLQNIQKRENYMDSFPYNSNMNPLYWPTKMMLKCRCCQAKSIKGSKWAVTLNEGDYGKALCCFVSVTTHDVGCTITNIDNLTLHPTSSQVHANKWWNKWRKRLDRRWQSKSLVVHWAQLRLWEDCDKINRVVESNVLMEN